MSPADAPFVADASHNGAALPAALRGWLPGTSWSQAKSLLRQRRVLVNDAVCLDEGRRLRPGDRVHVIGQPQPAPAAAADVVVRHLDRHLVVVEKPAGMRSVSHHTEKGHSAARRALHLSLHDALPELIARRESKLQRGDGPRRRRGKPTGPPARLTIVHRLDRDTSGLLVFARTDAAAESLIGQFKRHSVDRVYLAVVSGTIGTRTFESRLVDDRGDGRRGSTSLPGQGKRAVTHIRPLREFDGLTLIECRLETGRTHQIRIHLSEAGFPVCGDRRYHQPLFAPAVVDRSRAPRLALHAARLGFVHPATGESMAFDAPLPEDLRRWIDALKPTR